MRDEAARKGAFVELFECDNVVLIGNRLLLSRALENLLRNAIQHTVPGTVVEVHARVHQSKSGKNVQTEVCDRGPDIAEADRSRLVQALYRTKSSRQMGHRGTGVGLAIVDRVFKLHHGSLKINNRPDGGAAFVIDLPSDHSASVAQAAASSSGFVDEIA